jgi:CheY-like chemotaxis protein
VDPGGSGQTGQAPPRPRALVIDDETTIRELLAEMLEALGFRADAVTSGDEGLARLERDPYDLLITDLAMPRMTGWEVVAAVRARGLDLPVVLASGSIGNLDAGRARELRVTLLTKPFQLDELRSAVEPALARRSRPGEHRPAAAGPPTPGEAAAGGERDRAATGAIPDLATSVGRAVETMRRASHDIQALFTALEDVLREREAVTSRWASLEAEHRVLRETHEVLVGAHESVSHTLAELRQVHDALVRRHQDALGMLEAVREQLDGCIRDLRGGP